MSVGLKRLWVRFTVERESFRRTLHPNRCSMIVQVSTCMIPLPRATRRRPPARQLLLTAAARVFARDGLEGVNEVTLFRNFGTKEHLLEAVVGSAFGIALRAPDGKATPALRSLKSDLEAFSRRYEALLMENLPLIRTMVGEIHRHAVCQHQALRGIFLPMREALTERLRTACRLGEARPDINPLVAADLFAGTIFSEVLRRETLKKSQGYSSAEYRKASVSIFLRGIAADGTPCR